MVIVRTPVVDLPAHLVFGHFLAILHVAPTRQVVVLGEGYPNILGWWRETDPNERFEAESRFDQRNTGQTGIVTGQKPG